MKVESHDSLLIVDDVFDTGLSYEKVISDIKTHVKKYSSYSDYHPYFKPPTSLLLNQLLYSRDK